MQINSSDWQKLFSCQSMKPNRNKSGVLKTMTLHEKVSRCVPVSSSGRPLLHYNNPLQAIYFSFAMHSGIVLGNLIIPEGLFQRLNSTKKQKAF